MANECNAGDTGARAASKPGPSTRSMTVACSQNEEPMNKKQQAENLQKSNKEDNANARKRRKVDVIDSEENQKAKKMVKTNEISAATKQPEKDVRKKGSANKLIVINNALDDIQKGAIGRTGFGGLLLIKCSFVPEKLSLWLMNLYNTKTSELVVPFRGIIRVNDDAVHRTFGIPMGQRHIDYNKESGADTFFKFYEDFGHDQEQKAPLFSEVQKWLLEDAKGSTDYKWLSHWLVFTISGVLCPTSSCRLCVRAFHAIADHEKIKEYNWCRLVIERLNKGIKDFKEGKRKFVSGCLLLLIILYLDSLEVGDLVDQAAPIRVSVWTETLVNKVIKMDKSSDGTFGKLRFKAQGCRMRNMLIQPQNIEDFVNSNMPNDCPVQSRERVIVAFTKFGCLINQAAATLMDDLCGGGHIQLIELPQGNETATTAQGGNSYTQSCEPRATSNEDMVAAASTELIRGDPSCGGEGKCEHDGNGSGEEDDPNTNVNGSGEDKCEHDGNGSGE